MRRRAARRRLSMTSLIDVIFLLLLFFMLSSTFSRFAEVELAAAGPVTGNSDQQVSFLQLDSDSLSLNGTDTSLATLADALVETSQQAEVLPVIVSLREGVTAQRLTDLLVVLRGIDRIHIRVLGS